MSEPSERPTRARILDAADDLMRTLGLARTTTKQIARAAGCSEAALYKHFTSKEELFVRVLEERLPPLGPLLSALAADPGERSVEDNLGEIAVQAARFYEVSFPIAASLYAERRLLRRHHESLRTIDAGPRAPLEALAAYLRTEQAAGRLHRDADTDAAAALLLGACAQRAFLYDFPSGEQPAQPVEEFAASLARTVLAGIAP